MPSINEIQGALVWKCRQRGWMVKAQTRLTNQMKAIARSLAEEKLGHEIRDTHPAFTEPNEKEKLGLPTRDTHARDAEPNGRRDHVLADTYLKGVASKKGKRGLATRGNHVSAAASEQLGHSFSDTPRRSAELNDERSLLPDDTLRQIATPDSGEIEDQLEADTQGRSVFDLPLFFPFRMAMEPIKRQRSALEKEIGALAESLPVWNGWAKDIRGIGPLGLGLIVGAAGRDLSDYPNPGKLWKRFGLAPGQRRYTDREKALEAAYSPQRRSLMFNISEALMKQNDGYFRQVYDERKAYLMERSPEWKQMKKPKFGEEEGKVVVVKDAVWKYHQEALRYLAKRFLRDLWREWREQSVTVNQDVRPCAD